MIGHPGHPGLEVVHDAQGLGGSLEVIAGKVGDPDHLVATEIASLDIIHSDHRRAVHMGKETKNIKYIEIIVLSPTFMLPLVIFVLVKH